MTNPDELKLNRLFFIALSKLVFQRNQLNSFIEVGDDVLLKSFSGVAQSRFLLYSSLFLSDITVKEESGPSNADSQWV